MMVRKVRKVKAPQRLSASTQAGYQVRVAMKSFYCFYIFHKVLRVVVKEKWKEKLGRRKRKLSPFVLLTYKYLQRRQTLDVLEGFDGKTFKSAVLQYQTLQRSQPDEGLALDRE